LFGGCPSAIAAARLDTCEAPALSSRPVEVGTASLDVIAQSIKGGRSMRKLGMLAALTALLFTLHTPADAQVKGLYWTTSRMFGPFPIPDLIPTVPKEKARNITIPVSMWVIDHPKGLVVFDTGNNVAISDGGCKNYWVPGNCDGLHPSQKRDDVIDRQLQKLGYSTDKVKAV